jgi:CRP-like cAMP-binding protein
MLTSVERLLFVRGVPIFKELRDDFLVRLASIMEELSFPARHTIFQKGEEGRSLYIVVKGQVRIHIGKQDINCLGQGDAFGEMALFDSEPRSASVSTLDECECLILTQQQLYEAIDETPSIAVNIIRLLSRRIRDLNKDLSDQRKRNLELTKLLQPPGAAHSLPDFNHGNSAQETEAQETGAQETGALGN